MSPSTVTRKVGVCAHCATAVLLHIRRGERVASCACGATLIPRTFSHAIRAFSRRVAP